VEKLQLPIQTDVMDEGIRAKIARIWSGLGHEVSHEERSLLQVLTSMQQQGWSLVPASASSRVSDASRESGACTVLIGKLSRH
jgi:hypothetical protein